MKVRENLQILGAIIGIILMLGCAFLIVQRTPLGNADEYEEKDLYIINALCVINSKPPKINFNVGTTISKGYGKIYIVDAVKFTPIYGKTMHWEIHAGYANQAIVYVWE